MAAYKFDGTVLKEGSKTIAHIKGNEIREGTGSKVLANIKDDQIRMGTGSSVMFNIRGDDIRQGTGSSKIATMKEVDKVIDGPGKNVKAALWLVCCR